MEKFSNLEENGFEPLKKDELIQIKGGTEDEEGKNGGGIIIQKDGEFD